MPMSTDTADHSTMPVATPPELQCDVVMKGGITSGVVYNWALTELGATNRLLRVGGASAGHWLANLARILRVKFQQLRQCLRL